jgi:DNA-binding CsgD family transcriptional regulator
VRLSLIETKDLGYQKTHGLQALMQHVIVRLAREAYEQGAVLNTEDLAYLLRISESTVKRHKRLLKGSGVSLPLRGETADMGPASCHRIPIVELFLQGYSETEIAQRLNHGLERVEEYLYDFLRISLLLKDGYAVGMTGRLAKLSKAKVTSLQSLYERLSHEPFYREPLAKVLELFELRRRLRKKGVNR